MKGKYPGRLIFWLSALALLAVIAAACAPAAPAPTATPTKAAAPAATATTAPPKATATSAPPPTPTTPPVTKIKIAKSYTAVLNLAMFVAQKEGYYKEEGLDAEFVMVPGTAGLAALAAGEILFSDSSSSAMNAAMEGAPFRVVFTNHRAIQYVWLKDPVKKATDLVGKKYGCSSTADAACFMSQRYLQKLGLADITKVTWIGVGSPGDRLAAIRSGAVDGVYLSVVEHILMLPQDGKGFTLLGDVGSEFKVALGGLATSTVTIRNQKDLLQRAIRAVVKGQRFIMDVSKRDKTAAHLMEWGKYEREPALAALDVSLKEDGLFKDGIMPDEPTKNTIALGRESLKITAEFQPSQLFDNSFAQAAAKELDAKGWKP